MYHHFEPKKLFGVGQISRCSNVIRCFDKPSYEQHFFFGDEFLPLVKLKNSSARIYVGKKKRQTHQISGILSKYKNFKENLF